MTEEKDFLSLVHENSLEMALLEMGVLFEEIQKAKKEKLQDYRSIFSLYQYDYEEDTHLEFVPVDKIISLTDTRGEFGRTWWDHISLKTYINDEKLVPFLNARGGWKSVERKEAKRRRTLVG